MYPKERGGEGDQLALSCLSAQRRNQEGKRDRQEGKKGRNSVGCKISTTRKKPYQTSYMVEFSEKFAPDY